MHCPFCNFDYTIVKDSRTSADGNSVRRRRECPKCLARFTTFEKYSNKELLVIKKDKTKHIFDRDKITESIKLAVRKRPITEKQVNNLVDDIILQIKSLEKSEISTNIIGKAVMKGLQKLDQVAYVRFASVHTDFNAAQDFKNFIVELEES
ncbi:MAG: transcriptional regulator NrdR [Pseudomonadota bacterium]